MNDRFLRACRRQAVDATPVWFMRQAGRSLPEYRAIRERVSLTQITADSALCAEVTLQPVHRLGVDAAILFADISTPLPGVGAPVEVVDGVGPVIERPVRTPADLEALRPFEPESVRPLLDAIGQIRAVSPVPLIGFAGAPFTLASYLVEGRSAPDARRLKSMLTAEPDLAAGLLDRLTDLSIAYVRAQVVAGVQAIQIFDSWIGALSPIDYDAFVLPRMRRLFESIAALGVPSIHFGTGTAGLLERMARAGGDVIGLDWRVDLGDAWRRVDDRAVMGNLDPVTLLGPWPSVEDRASAILRAAGGRPGHIFNLGHGVLPETDPTRLAALVDFVHAFAPAAIDERIPA